MDVLALILACSMHPDDALVRTLVDIQSSGNPYFVGDLSTLKTNDGLKSPDDALRAAEDLARHGGRPAVGLLGVPLEWAARFGRQPRDLFDGCTNIAIATSMYSAYERDCSPRVRPAPRSPRRRGPVLRPRRASAAVRTCILTHLATDLGVQGTPGELLKRIDVRALPAQLEAPAHSSGIFGDGGDDAQSLRDEWSDRRIYLDAGDLPRGAAPPTSVPAPHLTSAAPTAAAPAARPSSPPRGLRPIPIAPVGAAPPSRQW